MTSVRVRRGIARGRVRPPGSKSISNRALIAASLAPGSSSISGLLVADDTSVMINGLRSLGVELQNTDGVTLVTPPELFLGGSVDVEASGTTMRFMAGLAGVVGPAVELDGTPRMRERPIGDLVEAMRMLGVSVEYLGKEGFPPLRIATGARAGVEAEIDAAHSSQFVSALMLAAPFTGEGLELHFTGQVSSRSYLQTTVEVMEAFGVAAEVRESSVVVSAGRYVAGRFFVEPDASSAVFMWGAAAATAGDVTVDGIGLASTQSDLGVLRVLEKMGCKVSRTADAIRVRGPKVLQSVTEDLADCPDAALMLAALAATASGPSTFTGLHTLKLKETDRLHALVTELTKIGAEVQGSDDALTIYPGVRLEAVIETYDDHRMAMAFGALSLAFNDLTILDPGCVAKTWPEFWDVLDSINTNRVVAIDGHAGVGKTSVSSAVAHDLGYTRLDTGALYRAVTFLGMKKGVDLADEWALMEALDAYEISFESGHIVLSGDHICNEIREPAVSRNVSEVSAHPKVRARMVAYQRLWVEDQGTGVVAEGRDMGTVVFPEASLKVFLTARPEVRAARRAGELEGDVSTIASEMAERDRKDSTRESSPTRRAEDAIEIDTSDVSIDEVVAQIVSLAQR